MLVVVAARCPLEHEARAPTGVGQQPDDDDRFSGQEGGDGTMASPLRRPPVHGGQRSITVAVGLSHTPLFRCLSHAQTGIQTHESAGSDGLSHCIVISTYG